MTAFVPPTLLIFPPSLSLIRKSHSLLLLPLRCQSIPPPCFPGCRGIFLVSPSFGTFDTELVLLFSKFITLFASTQRSRISRVLMIATTHHHWNWYNDCFPSPATSPGWLLVSEKHFHLRCSATRLPSECTPRNRHFLINWVCCLLPVDLPHQVYIYIITITSSVVTFFMFDIDTLSLSFIVLYSYSIFTWDRVGVDFSLQGMCVFWNTVSFNVSWYTHMFSVDHHNFHMLVSFENRR